MALPPLGEARLVLLPHAGALTMEKYLRLFQNESSFPFHAKATRGSSLDLRWEHLAGSYSLELLGGPHKAVAPTSFLLSCWSTLSLRHFLTMNTEVSRPAGAPGVALLVSGSQLRLRTCASHEKYGFSFAWQPLLSDGSGQSHQF